MSSLPLFDRTWPSVVQDVCRKYGLAPGSVRVKAKAQRIARPRHEVCYQLRAQTGLSYRRIGEILGGHTKSAVIYAVQAHASRTGQPVPRSLR